MVRDHKTFTVLQGNPPPNPPPQPPPPGGFASTGIYYPMYNIGNRDAIITIARAHPRVRFLVAINPASGPGDIYVPGLTNGVIPVNAQVRDAIPLLNAVANITTLGYVASWYGKATDNPPEGNRWSCMEGGVCTPLNGHCDVLYSMDQNQVNTARNTGIAVKSEVYPQCPGTATHITRRAIYIPDLVNRYRDSYPGLKGLMVDEGATAGMPDPVNAKRDFYRAYFAYARQSSVNLPFIVCNPGTGAPGWMYQAGGADVVSCFEGANTAAAISNAQTGFIQAGNNKGKVKVLIYNQAVLPSQAQILQLGQYAGWIYIATDNSWMNVPSYLGQLATILETNF